MIERLGCPGGAERKTKREGYTLPRGVRENEARANGSAAESGRNNLAYPSLPPTLRGAVLNQVEVSEDGAAKGALVSQLSREIVQLHVRFYGRGPTKARSYLQADYAVCILEEIFTTAERTLIDAGSGEHVHETRRKFQAAVKSEFIAIVERVTGRRVRSFLSQVDIDSNMSVDVFVFAEPETPV